MLVDISLDELKKYKPSQNKEKNFEIMEFYDHSWETHIRFEEKKLQYLIKYL